MKISQLSTAVGVEIIGVDLSKPISTAQFMPIREAFLDHSVIVFRGQSLTSNQLVAFSNLWGPSEPYGATVGEFLMPGQPEVLLLSNIVENGKAVGAQDAGRYWHTDGSYVRKPAWGSLLYAREVPKGDDGRTLGDTRFASMAAAFDALPREDRDCISKLTACHKYIYRYTKRDTQLPGVSHPMVLKHPLTGRQGIYVNAGFTDHVENVDEMEGKRLLDRLYEHIENPDFTYRHHWEAGDLIIWDNYATQHRATGDFGTQRRRLMWRTTIQGFDLTKQPDRDRTPDAIYIDQRDPKQVAAASLS